MKNNFIDNGSYILLHVQVEGQDRVYIFDSVDKLRMFIENPESRQFVNISDISEVVDDSDSNA